MAAILAALVSLPPVALALIAAAYISYSLATESWYRSLFGGYGAKLLLLYVLFSAGVVAAAAIALRGRGEPRRTVRLTLYAICTIGVVAALSLEFLFWTDSDRLLPPGLLLLPFVGWAAAAFSAARDRG